MIGLGGISGGGANAAVAFLNEGLVVEGFVYGVAPVLLAYALVGVLGEGFGEAVAESLGEDGVVVVVSVFELAGKFIDAFDTAGEGTAGIGVTGTFGGDEVGQCVVGIAGGFALLLAKGVKGGAGAAVFVVEADVVANGVCRKRPTTLRARNRFSARMRSRSFCASL